MKKSLIIAFLTYFCSSVIAQEYICLKDGSVSGDKPTKFTERTIENTDKGILATYKFNYASRHTDEFFPSASVLLLEGFGIPEDSEKPALPYKLDRFAIPGNEPYKIVITDSSYIELPMEIAPSRPPIVNSSNGFYSREIIKPIRPYLGYYPENVLTSVLNPYRSTGIVDIHISPIQYDYLSKKVRIFKNLSYLIECNNAVVSKANLEGTETDLFLSNIVMNPKKNVNRFLDSMPRISSTHVTAPGYLIITVPDYLNAVNKFADWKRTLGFKVKISCDSNWNETSIKDSVISYAPTPIHYLLIVGDYEDVPGQALSDSVYTSDGWEHYNYVSDFYYGCVHQNTYPEIRRGRIPVSSVVEAMTVVNKIIQYERDPLIDSVFYKTGLNCAYFQDKQRDSIEDVRFTLTSENIRNYLKYELGKTINRVYCTQSAVSPKYWNNGQFGFWRMKIPIPYELQRDSGFLWNGKFSNIITSINNGSFYVLHRDHGSVNTWGDPYFHKNHIDSLSNGKKLPVVFSMNCLTGRYNGNTCFAEKFLRKNNGGCVAIFAATETNFSGYNDALTIGMFDALWPSNGYFKSFPNGNDIELSMSPVYRLGDILDIGQQEIGIIYSYAGNKGIKHTNEVFHCFGDPTMEMYTDTPTPFANVSVSKNNNNVEITLQEIAKITFYNTLTGVQDSYYGASVSYPYSNDLRICVSAHNKIPLIMDGGTMYIQNEEITSSINYEADAIKVGSSVTSLKSPGDVIISSGTTKLKGGTVELREGTTIETGAQLEINN